MRLVWLGLCGLLAFIPAGGKAHGDPVQLALARNATIGLIAGQAGSTDAEIASELAQALDDGSQLRILPMQGSGTAQNVADLIFRKGVDVALVHTDAVSELLRDNAVPREETLRFIANLFPEEVHVLARRDVTSIQDLNGKLVNFGTSGSDAELTATQLFARLRIKPQGRRDSDAVALDRLRLGEVAAMVLVGGQPIPLLRTLAPGSGLHFLAIPFNAALLEDYLPTKLTHQPYPNLVLSGRPVPTVSVGAALVTLSAPRNSLRSQRVNRFVDALFAHLDQLRGPGRHPKWQEVHLGSGLAGLPRYARAQTILHASAQPQH